LPPQEGMGATHAFEEHVSEVALRVRGESLADVFAETAKGLFELMGARGLEELPEAAGGEVEVTLSSRDLAGLLVDWLNELLLRAETERMCFTVKRFEALSAGGLRATLSPRACADLRPLVKAATWHRVAVRREDDGWHAYVVFDV
jgi:SHS2 domain-containing protein